MLDSLIKIETLRNLRQQGRLSETQAIQQTEAKADADAVAAPDSTTLSPHALQAAHDYYQRGEALLENSLFEQAAVEYQKALDLAPRNRFVALRLEHARQLAGADVKALKTTVENLAKRVGELETELRALKAAAQ